MVKYLKYKRLTFIEREEISRQIASVKGKKGRFYFFKNS